MSVEAELNNPFAQELADESARLLRKDLRTEREILTQGIRYSRIEADSHRIHMNMWTKRAEEAAARLAKINKLLGE